MRHHITAAALGLTACVAAEADRKPGSGSGSATSQGLTIVSARSRPSSKGPEANFTGSVRVEPLFNPTAPGRTSAAYVTFDPGARSAWHRHPLGQTLVVTAGTGRIQRRGGPIQELKEGDVVWTPPNEMHWHGASPTTSMTHMAIQEQLAGKAVEWSEQVTDAEYGK